MPIKSNHAHLLGEEECLVYQGHLERQVHTKAEEERRRLEWVLSQSHIHLRDVH